MSYKIDEIVQVAQDNDNENYDYFRDMDLIITHIATSEAEHPGYDSSMEGMQLLDFVTISGDDVPFSLYEYEVE